MSDSDTSPGRAAGSGTATAPSLALRIALSVLVAAGVVGFALQRGRLPREQELVEASGVFWVAQDASGTALTGPRNLGGVTLQPGDAFRLHALPAGFAWDSLSPDLRSVSVAGTVPRDHAGAAGTGAHPEPKKLAMQDDLTALPARTPWGQDALSVLIALAALAAAAAWLRALCLGRPAARELALA